MRINRYIARCGVTSRRGAEKLIKAGRISIDNHVIHDLATTVEEGQVVSLDGVPLRFKETHYYLAYHKPYGMVTTMRDPQGRTNLGEVVADIGLPLFPVGRLDRDTSGLIILTNDGDLAHRMMHPSYELTKTYLAQVEGEISLKAVNTLRDGVNIGNYVCRPAQVVVLQRKSQHSLITLTIHEGKNRQVRRMCQAVGYPVKRLERISIGPISIERLSAGQYRHLTREEVQALKKAVIHSET